MAAFQAVRALTLAGAVLAAAALPASAQRVSQQKIIDFHLNSEQRNVSVGGSVMEGDRFRLTIQGAGTYALSMVQLDAARKLFTVTVFRGGGEGDTTTYRPVETVQATANVPAPLRSLRYTAVVIEGTRSPAANAATASLFNLAAYTRRLTAVFQDRCCVTCGNVTACGCAVSHDCGSCCVTPCCEKQPAPPPGGGMAQYFPDRPIQNAGRSCKEVPVNERLYPALYTGDRIASR
jgi:hypothetical protein